MTLPAYLVAKNAPSGNTEPHGLIYSIRSRVSNFISCLITSSDSSNVHGSLESIVKWDNGWQGYSNNNFYVQLEFKNRYVFPTHYSFKGWSQYYYTNEWYFYGLNSPSDIPTLLSENASAKSTFCDGSTSVCSNNEWGTFEISVKGRGFRYFRIVSKKSTYPGSALYMAFSGFDIFGTLSLAKMIEDGIEYPLKKALYFRSYPKMPRINFYLSLRFMISLA